MLTKDKSEDRRRMLLRAQMEEAQRMIGMGCLACEGSGRIAQMDGRASSDCLDCGGDGIQDYTGVAM